MKEHITVLKHFKLQYEELIFLKINVFVVMCDADSDAISLTCHKAFKFIQPQVLFTFNRNLTKYPKKHFLTHKTHKNVNKICSYH